MPNEIQAPPVFGPRALTAAASFVIVVAGMKLASPIIVPFLLSVFIAIICAPLLYLMKQKGLPTFVAILLLVAMLVSAGLLIGVLIGSSVNEFTANLPQYKSSLQVATHESVQWLNSKGFHINEETVLSRFNPGTALQLAANTLSGLTNLLAQSFLILLTVVFILLEASSFPKKIMSAAKSPNESMVSITRFTHSVNRYLAIKSAFSAITGGCVYIFLVFMGIDFPVLWALLAFLLNFVPNIGSILAAIPVVLLSVVQFGFGASLGTAIFYLSINTIIGSIIEPRFMGKDLGLSPLVVFLSLVFWGWILGPVGMLLSVPLTMVMKIAFESYSDTRWIAIMLGN